MSLARYANLTGASGADARGVKARIRQAIAAENGTITRIYRNPISTDGHPYRFIRVHYETKDQS